ncbi:hypothetical protein PISMIDRAFT_18814 [Pisolithus microcarpus 441]|uniref:Uncharacterized protein n=1 Tax=Pisolithus microcarpus 441 TaxID=765257 RepID=A0A0C9XJ07_9AGAM|nr:hypothetical protein BKA83DRAFT_18814 [Pisolithus microcarpus]KIK12320.1 hypothetical protein PISMIDRAFT_18814 [Pisolithus microcarpus 441]
MGRFDARDGDRKSNVSTGDRSPPTRPTISQLNTGVGDRKSDVSTGDRSLPMRPTVGQPNTGDGDRKSDVSTGNRSPPTRPTISQLNTGYDDRKTSVSMGDKSPPTWQMAGQLERSALGKSIVITALHHFPQQAAPPKSLPLLHSRLTWLIERFFRLELPPRPD